MRGGDVGFLPRGKFVKPGVAQPAGPILARVVGDGHAGTAGVVQEELHTAGRAEFTHKVCVGAGSLAPDAMIDMGGEHLDFKVSLAAQKKQQEGHRVCPAGAGRNDPVACLEQALPLAIGKQGLLCLLDDLLLLVGVHRITGDLKK